MPTPAKLVAALLMAGLAWYVCEIILVEILERETSRGWFREIVAAGAFLIGWKVIGRAATGVTGRGGRIVVVLTSGIGAAFILLALGVILNSFIDMITTSLGGRYTEMGIAMNAWLKFMWRDVQIVMHQAVLLPLFVGAAVIGLVSGIVGRVWH